MYLDNEIIYTEHLCCMAHARPKFKYASEQGGNMDANYFLDCIVELYKLEAEYDKGLLSLKQIKGCWNSLKTKES